MYIIDVIYYNVVTKDRQTSHKHSRNEPIAGAVVDESKTNRQQINFKYERRSQNV
jgi:hypothetical protein